MKPQTATQALKVNEIFYSLQGEGARAGEPSLFIRLSGCSAKYACYGSGVRCDTEFESGLELSLEQIVERIRGLSKDCRWIVWTGGEPADQLTDDVVDFFHGKGYKQAIETSGLRPVPQMLDWIVVSPKVAVHVVLKNFPMRPDGTHCDELRWIRHKGQGIPTQEIKAKTYYISPHSDGLRINSENVEHCIRLCLENPQWRLSIQQHKMLNVL